jgi:DNA-3-methyladenine glycosylase
LVSSRIDEVVEPAQSEQNINHQSQIGNRKLKKLPRSFYLRPTPRVAKDLLGKYLVRRIEERVMIARIVETEAYCQDDPASHSFRGLTKRNEVMFSKGGHLYVYFTYGMHFCANVVTGRAGKGEAVLLRAVEPIDGFDIMSRNRKHRVHGRERGDAFQPDLTNGPAKLCEALKIRRKENGTDLLGDEIYLLDSPRLRPSEIARSRRIGIRVGRKTLWRFFIKESKWVSR